MEWIFGSSYRTIILDGIHFHVVKTNNYQNDLKAAKKLAYLNAIALQVMKYTRIYIQKYKEGTLRSEDLAGVDFGRLIYIHDMLVERYSIDQIYEVSPGGDNKSYVLDLGKEIHLCVRSDSKPALVAVLIHELAHVGNESPDHDDSFWQNHAILSRIASQMGIIAIDEVPANGTRHCGRIDIPYQEVAKMAYDPKDYNEDHISSSYHRILSNPHLTSDYHPSHPEPTIYHPDIVVTGPKIMTNVRSAYSPLAHYMSGQPSEVMEKKSLNNFYTEDTVTYSTPQVYYMANQPHLWN